MSNDELRPDIALSLRPISTATSPAHRPKRAKLPARDVRDFRQALEALRIEEDLAGRRWLNAKWGVYAFYDYDGEPIY